MTALVPAGMDTSTNNMANRATEGPPCVHDHAACWLWCVSTQTIMDLLREDFAPFNVRVSMDPNDWATWPNNRVRAAIMQNATVSNNVDVTCGRAIVGDYTRAAGATAWVSCGCFPDVISHEVRRLSASG